MTFDELRDFVQTRMRMSHIYQPLLIKTLLESGGMATVRQIAHAFLTQDESQLLYYEKRITDMPVPVLKRRGVVEKDGQLVRLTLKVGKLTFKEKAQLKALCDQKIQEFLEKRGLATWDYSLMETDPVPDTVRFDVLRRAGGRCELCGVSSKERPLHVDHIIPRSKRGKNDPDNLQALCAKCNLGKGNRDATDFRGSRPEKEDGCPFCAEDMGERTVETNGSVFAVRDAYPVTEWHCLVVPFRHATDYFTLTDREREESGELARYLRNYIQRQDDTVTGFNLGWNCGETAGQTVMHAHLHVMPRRAGDVPNPRGGIRGALPHRMSY